MPFFSLSSSVVTSRTHTKGIYLLNKSIRQLNDQLIINDINTIAIEDTVLCLFCLFSGLPYNAQSTRYISIEYQNVNLFCRKLRCVRVTHRNNDYHFIRFEYFWYIPSKSFAEIHYFSASKWLRCTFLCPPWCDTD